MFALVKLFKKCIPRSRWTSGRNDKKWKKVKELRVGMKIAVPRAGLLEDHLQSRQGTALNAGQGREPDVQWDEIVAIKPLGREQVYDIEVEGARNFVGNNIFAHNTYISGNVGIGSSTPGYKLAVEGEVAAQAFVNISSEATKKDIAYLSEDEDKTILDKIRATNVATYQYRSDNPLLSNLSPEALAKGEEGPGVVLAGSPTPPTPPRAGGDLTNGKRLGLIAENAPPEVLATGGKGVDLYKLGTFTLAGLKAESRERESGVLALDTRIASEMASLREKTTTKQLTVLGSANGDLLYIATGEAGGPGADIAKADVEPSLNNQSPDPIFRITAGGEVRVRDDIVFGPKTTTIALNNPQWVAALSADEAQEQLRPAFKGAVIVAGAADRVHVFNAKTHKEMSGYAYNNPLLNKESPPFQPVPRSLLSPEALAKGDGEGGGGVRGGSEGGGSDSPRTTPAPLLAEEGTRALPKHITSDYFTQSFDENTLGQWPFRTLADATGKGNDLSMAGSVSLAAEGVRGAGAAFDGSGYLSAGAVSSPPFQPVPRSLLSPEALAKGDGEGGGGAGVVADGSTPTPPTTPSPSSRRRGISLTLGAWVKFNSLSSGQKIISQDGAFSLALGEGGYPEATAQGASKAATRQSLAALDNDWHYVVASYSALKGRLDIYVDGVLANGDLVGEIPLTGLGLSSEPVKLGVGFYGAMDDAFLADSDVAEYPPLAKGGTDVAEYPPLAKGGTKGGLSPETIRTNYLIGRKALNYGLAATSGLQAQPTSAAIDEVNNILYVGATDGRIITVDLSASAVVGKINPLLGQEGISALAVASGAGRTLAAIIGNNLWLDTEPVSVRDSLDKTASAGTGRDLSPQGAGITRRELTVFSDLLVTGGKILPEASSGLPLFAITADGVVEGLAFRDVSFANELVNASFEYWESVPPLPDLSAVALAEEEGGLRGVGEKPVAWQGSKKSADAKFGSASIQVTDGVLSTTVNNASDFASSTVTLSAWVKSSIANDVKLSIIGGRDAINRVSTAESAYHSGSGQWERLIVSTVIPSSVIPAEAGIQIQIASASKTAMVDGVMFQRGSLPTAFVPSVQDTLLANPQYLNFTTAISVNSSSSPSSAGPMEGLLAKLPSGTFRNAIRIDQLSVGLASSPPLQPVPRSLLSPEALAKGDGEGGGGAGVVSIQIIATNGIDTIVCVAAGSSCRSSGSLIISPDQELLIKYSVQGPDAGSGSGMTTAATVNLRYYPAP